jgi:hypothetical protein
MSVIPLTALSNNINRSTGTYFRDDIMNPKTEIPDVDEFQVGMKKLESDIDILKRGAKESNKK